jgi:hypothetical protein
MADIIKTYADAIYANDEVTIRKLHEQHSLTSDSSFTSSCSCGCDINVSIRNILISDGQTHKFQVKTKAKTYKLLIDLGILSSSDIKFLEDFAQRICCFQEVERFYEILDFFDKKAIGTYRSCDASLASFMLCSIGLGIPIWRREQFISTINKLLSYGCEFIKEAALPCLSTDIDKLKSLHITYDPITNSISQSSADFAQELNEYLSYDPDSMSTFGRVLDTEDMQLMIQELDTKFHGVLSYDKTTNRVSVVV